MNEFVVAFLMTAVIISAVSGVAAVIVQLMEERKLLGMVRPVALLTGISTIFSYMYSAIWFITIFLAIFAFDPIWNAAFVAAVMFMAYVAILVGEKQHTWLPIICMAIAPVMAWFVDPAFAYAVVIAQLISIGVILVAQYLVGRV